MNKFFSVVGAIVTWLVMLVLTAFVQGVVLMNLWNWFMVPLGVMKVNLAMAFGLSLTISMFIDVKSNSNSDDKSSALCDFFGTIIGYLIIWGIGAIVVLFI